MSTDGIESPDGLPVVYAADRDAWRAWLADHHDDVRPGAWLVFYKKNASTPSITYEQAVEEAIAFGWIDSRPNKVDDARYIQLFSKRKPTSVWSRSNKERVERLLAQGRMAPAGLAAVEAAKANGSWDKLESVQSLEEPADLAAALDANPPARQNYDAFPPSSKRIILEWIANAKRPETRAARIAETSASAQRNVRANHYRQPGGRG